MDGSELVEAWETYLAADVKAQQAMHRCEAELPSRPELFGLLDETGQETALAIVEQFVRAAEEAFAAYKRVHSLFAEHRAEFGDAPLPVVLRVPLRMTVRGEG